MAKPRKPLHPDVVRIINACHTLIPLVTAVKEQLAKGIKPRDVALAMPALDEWVVRYEFFTRGIEVAVCVYMGEDAFDIVAAEARTRRTSADVKRLYKRWLVS